MQREVDAHRARSARSGATRRMHSENLSEAMLEAIAARFRLLGEPLRLKLLMALESGERNVGELVTETGAGQANVSKHLAALAQAGIVRRRKVGTSTYYAIADDTAFTLCDVVCSGLEEHLAAQVRALGLDDAGRDQPALSGTKSVPHRHSGPLRQ